MATFNGERFLTEQIDSILNQDYYNKELIIVDDGSTDRTIEIINSYTDKYDWIRLSVHDENLGIVRTFQDGITLSSGEYVFLCDQDDIWLDNKITVMVESVGDSLLIHSDAKLIDEKSKIFCESFMDSYKDNQIKTFADYLFATNVTGCCTMLTRELVNIALPIPDEFYIHDHYFALVAANKNRVKYIPDKLVLYRQHNENSMGAAKSAFNVFLNSSYKIAKSYDAFKNKFNKQNNVKQLNLVRDYKMSIYNGFWSSDYSILELLYFRGGARRILYFYLITGFGSRKLAKIIYNKIHQL